MADNMADIRKLRSRVEQVAKEMHLELAGFAITPAKDEDGNDILTISALIKVEALESIEETEQRGFDDEFDKIFAANFGEGEDFLSDESKKMIEKDRLMEQQAKDELQAMLDEFEGK